MSLRRFYGSLCDSKYPSLVHPSLLLAMSSLAFLFFASCGHKPPPIPRNRFNPSSCHQRRRFPAPRYVKRLDVALYTIDLPFLLPARSSPHCTLKVPNSIRLGIRPPLIRVSVTVDKSIFVRKVVSLLSHPLILRAWLL